MRYHSSMDFARPKRKYNNVIIRETDAFMP
eukprot:SAG11_NODE_31031_length_295_cov_1.061224_1_plen_29_part_10